MLVTQKDVVRLEDAQTAFPRARGELMCPPDFFEVVLVKNPHMEGNIGRVDLARAVQQWEAVKQAYIDYGQEVSVMDAHPELEDIVFTANHGLMYMDEHGVKKVIPAKMYAQRRAGEIPHFIKWCQEHNYETVDCFDEPDDFFEGAGDALWHAGKKVLLTGYGFRTRLKALEKIARVLECPVVALRLVDPRFYHLDTCLSVLDHETAMVVTCAFEPEGLDMIKALFKRIIPVNPTEAEERLACNALCPDEKHVLLSSGCPETSELLKKEGFSPVGLDTSEFLKSGGSVACMQLRYW